MKSFVYKKPELLAPAGTFEKMKIAFKYGADAVYLGGTNLSLRRASSNFTIKELFKAMDHSKKINKKVYIALNISAHNDDIKELLSLIEVISKINPDAVIVSDAGVFDIIKSETHIPLHISTQASVTNEYGVRFWKTLGAKRVILARETSLEELREIKEKLKIELEVFIHGAMCVGYSGKCVISNYIAKRDANRGGCIQSCRYPYSIYDNDMKVIDKNSYFMSSKDLMTVRIVPEILNAQVDSLKIEGRMKSNMYVANTVSIYRDVIDYCHQYLNKTLPDNFHKNWENELSKVSNRSFTEGYLKEKVDAHSIRKDESHYFKDVEYVGVVKACQKEKKIVALQVKSAFRKGERLEFLLSKNKSMFIEINDLYDINNVQIEKALPNTIVLIKANDHISPLTVVRRKINE